MPETIWTGSLHQTFRLVGAQSPTLVPFLESDGLTQEQVLERLPYDEARAQARGGGGTGRPDPKRYRDPRQVYQTAGLLYEQGDGRLKITELGRATLRWASIINDKNAVILARHAAYALSACQLRNPSGAGRKYSEEMLVFPFQFIWRAMLALDGKISSDELNRALFKVKNEEDLLAAISSIRRARQSGQLSELGDEIITGEKKKRPNHSLDFSRLVWVDTLPR
ncbi:hypothetical protein [Burkholderia pseudomallei]|uniref:hypothetical protein n=1 Tax=Burkholderia pseudomallei TaxID=28450 RepID=UPI00100B620C|nr:hypothetical protein [Burkholderia pseudomallei]